jgi:hypothetical protein
VAAFLPVPYSALDTEAAAALIETTVLMAMTAWQCSHPSEAMMAAYASDPAIGAIRVDFTGLVRRTVEVTASGDDAAPLPALRSLLARQGVPGAAPS